MSKDNTHTKKRIARKPLFIAGGALAVVGLLVATFAFPALLGPIGFGSSAASGDESLYGDPDAEIAAAIAQMNAIADGAAQAMAEAGAAAEAEFNASADAAASVVSDTGAEGEAAIGAVGEAEGVLESAPEDFDGNATGDVAGTAASFTDDAPYHEAYLEYTSPEDIDGYEDNNASVRGRLALGVPLTGNDAIDAQLFAAVDAYVNVKNNINATSTPVSGNITIVDNTLGSIFVGGEGASHQAAPDYRRADDAYAHGEAVVEKASDSAHGILSGINVTFETQVALEESVRAELEAMATAQADAEAEIDATLEAAIEQSLSAEADATAEAHLEAQQRVQFARDAHVEAKKKLHAETEAQVEAVYSKSAEASEALELQADAALAHADEVAESIWAQADATLGVLAEIESRTGTDTSAQAEAVASAAAAAEAEARANAQATASALVRQAAMVRAAADIKAQAVLSASADLEAAIDAKLSVVIDTTVKAEAYTVAKIHAKAQADIKAHANAAAYAKAQIAAKLDAKAKVMIEAAMKANLAARANIDGSKDVTEMIQSDMVLDVQRDVDIIHEVAGDYEKQSEIPQYQAEAQKYNDLASDLDTDAGAVYGTTTDIQDASHVYYDVLATSYKEFEILGQRYI